MCTRVTCRKCGKPSYSGCGHHVEQVLGDVPKSQRCRCAEEKAAAKKAARAAAGPSWLDRLLSR
jgi:hypothetical protein